MMRKAVSQKLIVNRQFLSKKNDILNSLIGSIQPEHPDEAEIVMPESPSKIEEPVDSLTLLLNKAKKAVSTG